MNEDQVIGSIRGLQWALKTLRLKSDDRNKLYNEIDGLWARLAELRGEPKPKSVKPQPPPPPPPEPVTTPEEMKAREAKRIELERRIEAKTGKSNPYFVDYSQFKEPAYTEEPSDYRPLPHFGARE